MLSGIQRKAIAASVFFILSGFLLVQVTLLDPRFDVYCFNDRKGEEYCQIWNVVFGTTLTVIDRFNGVIVAVFTVVLGIATGYLAWATKRLVRSSEQTAELNLRAFVYNRPIQWKAFVRAGSPWKNDVGWMFTTEWRNNGPTQARRFLNHTNWEVFRDESNEDLPAAFEFRDMGFPARGATFIAPSVSTLSEHLPIDANILEAVRVGQLRLLYWGWVTYEDIFGAKRQTQFCFELNRIDGDPYDVPIEPDKPTKIFFNFRVCGRYNCADEDC